MKLTKQKWLKLHLTQFDENQSSYSENVNLNVR